MSNNGMELARELLRALPPDGRDRHEVRAAPLRPRRGGEAAGGRAVRGDLDYLYGDCILLALAVGELTGWPVVQIVMAEDDER